jgi:hypothetical protein
VRQGQRTRHGGRWVTRHGAGVSRFRHRERDITWVEPALVAQVGFTEWNWSRAQVEGGTAVLYDVVRRDRSHDMSAEKRSGSIRTDPKNRNAPFSFSVPGSLFPIRSPLIAAPDRS